MVLNPLPPQAYTKDTLVKAYQWLQNQPESIKEIALTPDILVSLFTKAQMQGDQVLERPSIQNFKNELRNLAGIMTDLKEPTQATVDLSAPQLSEVPSVNANSPAFQADPKSSRTLTALASQAARGSYDFIEPPPSAAEKKIESVLPNAGLDEKSLAMIRAVKDQLNLSSDSECLRLLISVGYSKIKGL